MDAWNFALIVNRDIVYFEDLCSIVSAYGVARLMNELDKILDIVN